MPRNVIVCVDDEKIILDSLRDQLDARFGEDFDVEVAEGGEEGLEIIEEIRENGDQLALVVSDHLMPGMKGDDFLIRVHKDFPETLKILLTGQASLESVGKAINHARIYRYVVKPWEEEDLMLTVEKALNSFLQYLQLQEYNRLLKALNTSIQDISAEVNIQNVIDKVINSTLDTTRAEKGYLLLQDDGNLKLTGVGAKAKEEELRVRELLRSNGQDLTDELIQKISETPEGGESRDRIVSPINKKGKNLGYVYIENPTSRDKFSDNQRQILQMLASQAAISLDNATLYAKLEEKNTALHENNKIIQQKNEDITDSIKYAKRIQDAILPNPLTLTPFLPNSSIFFVPRDIVSGDFYWWLDKGEWFMLCAADCTGHGVPGGFMSVLSNTMLNEAVNVYGLTDANAVLQFISLQLVDVLNQNQVNTGKDPARVHSKDGMDCALLSIHHTKRFMQYSGARRPLWRVRGGMLEVVPADKLSIGELPESGEGIPFFTNHEIEIEPGDRFYLFSDGPVDQFGGPDNRRFNRKRFAQAVLDVQGYEMTQHAQRIGQMIQEWQGGAEQTDDMLLMCLEFQEEDMTPLPAGA